MKRYCITLLYDSMELDKHFETDSPKTALNKWLEYSIKRPTMANISCGSVDDCLNLYKTFVGNKYEYYKKYWVERRFPYKFEYIYSECYQKLDGSKRLYFSGSKNFYDSVHPFCYG